MTKSQRWLAIVGFFALLLIVDWFLYFQHASHFFQGDSIFLLNHRATSLSAYLKEFVELNPSGWYRPLANELIQSIFYPVVGLNPVPYRIPVYVVFFAITVGVYALSLAVTRRHLAAALAAVFFSIHTTNAFTTYDVGFMPELLYTIFYIGATLAFFRYMENGQKNAYGVSLACFIAALLSKEAAVTLPAVLLLAGILFGGGSNGSRERLMRSVRSTAPHILISVLYLAFVVGYLDVQSLSVKNLVTAEQVPNPGDYIPVLTGGVFKNADLAFTWGFNIPRGGFGQQRGVASIDVGYLKFFRLFALALAAVVLIRAQAKVVLFGWAWFWITLSPALPLVNHFIPYYLFLPVIGLSIVVGIAFVWLYDVLSRIRQFVAVAAIVLIFGGVLLVTNDTIHGEIENNWLLGRSAALASNTLNDLKRSYPKLPSDATIYFADGRESLQWEHDSGGLIKMAYRMENITTLYESRGDVVLPDTQNVLVFGVQNEHLVDQTSTYRSNPTTFIKFKNSDLKLDVSPAEVTAGRDKYTISVDRLSNVPVRIAYTVDDGPIETFTASLDSRGQITYEIYPNTRKGVYKFWAFAVSDSSDWVRVERSLIVR